jgi:hypothetical protein
MTIERRQACLAVLGAVVLFVLAPAMSSGAGVPDQPLASLPAGERWLREVEVRGLGPAHAAEHARLRAAGRPHPTAQRTTAVTAAATEPVDVGRWLPKFSIPGVAVHAVMLHTGKILYFTGTTQGRAYLLDPVTRTTRAVHPPRIAEREDEPANIFCAGQSFLDDGTVLVMGGTIGRAIRRTSTS